MTVAYSAQLCHSPYRHLHYQYFYKTIIGYSDIHIFATFWGGLFVCFANNPIELGKASSLEDVICVINSKKNHIAKEFY